MNANNGLITYLEPFFFCLTLIKGGGNDFLQLIAYLCKIKFETIT